MKGPGAGNPFWAAVEAGAKEKGKELGVEVVVLAPPAESDVQAQIAQVEDQIAKGVDGIAHRADRSRTRSRPVVDAAKAKGVRVVFIDTKGINEGVTFIGTNNEVGAALAAEFICKNDREGLAKSRSCRASSPSRPARRAPTAPRRASTGCGLKVVAEQPAEWDRAKGQSVTENILTGNPNIKAVFASNDNMALGAVEALKAADKLDGRDGRRLRRQSRMRRTRSSPARWRRLGRAGPKNMGALRRRERWSSSRRARRSSR